LFNQHFIRRVSTLVFACLMLAVSAGLARGQDDARAIWQIQRYDINVSTAGKELSGRAVVSVKNIGRAAGTTVTLRIAKAAVVGVVKVNENVADFRPGEESRGGLQKLTVSVPSSPPDVTVQIAVEYKLPVAANSGLAAVSPLGSQFLPPSAWYPSASNPYTTRGTETAPFNLTVNAGGLTVVSSGKLNNSAFSQSFDAIPFFTTGNWDVIDGSGDAAGISAYVNKGGSAAERKQADVLIATAAAARTYFIGLLGPAPDLPVRLVSVYRGGGFTDGGTLLVDAAAFRRGKLDSITASQTAECVVRSWLGAAVPIRGDGSGIIREALVHYLVSLFIEKQFGREAVDAVRQRERTSYVAVVKRDAPLTMTTPLEDTYFNTVVNKGAMFWRLMDQMLGRDAFLALLRSSAQTARQNGAGLNLLALRTALNQSGATVKAVADQLLDQPTDLDLMVGLPTQRGADWVSQLRNLGSFEVTTTAVATTAKGERLTARVTVPARGFSEAVFRTANPITRVEIDPDKLYPQIDYTNDISPRGKLTESAVADAKSAFDRGEFAKAEGIAREVLALYPLDEDARLRLARSLLGQNKLGDAEKELMGLLDGKFSSPIALGWASAEMGELRMRQNQPAAAAKFFDDAVKIGGDYGATVAARAGRIKAETAAGSVPIDDTAKSFFAGFDRTVVTGRRSDLDTLIVSGELSRFSQPQKWQTTVLRTETLDANRMAVDVSLNVQFLDSAAAGTAVMVMARVGTGWKLEDIQFLEVH
jgi:tetratricopeptide (TPR) repeat protein